MPGLITSVFNKIDTSIVNYAADKSAAIATTIEPAVVAGMSIYLLVYGYKHFMGQVDQPFMAFVDSTVKMVGITGVALGTGVYSPVIIDTFQNSPLALAAALSGGAGGGTITTDLGTMLDGLFNNSLDIGMSFWDDAGLDNIGGYFVAGLVWITGLAVTAYTAFLILLSKISTGVVLALSPMFIVSLLWEKTQGYFANFLNTVINQGMILVLAVATSKLILSMYEQVGADLAAAGASAQIVDILGLVLIGGIGLLCLAQVTSLASSVAGGVSMSSFGMGRAVINGLKKAELPGKQGRENQRSAVNQIDVQKRKEKLVARAEARKPRGGSVTGKTGTNG